MTGKNRSVSEAYVDDRYPWLDKAVQDKSEIITASKNDIDIFALSSSVIN